jgi:hypothetical protein
MSKDMKVAAAISVLALFGCSGGETSQSTRSTPTSATIKSHPPLSALADPGCGTTPVYKGGTLPDWASVNAPSFLPYVIATPAIAVGYLFSYPLAAGLDANTKILWYVATPRDGFSLEAVGHPLRASSPTATFRKAADSSPGEIFPTGPTVPLAGCWHFTLSWHNGDQRADVDLLFTH